jgi:uncharacterized integral membrane protein
LAGNAQLTTKIPAVTMCGSHCTMVTLYILPHIYVIDMIYMLTAIGLTPGGSSTVHIYTQTIHRTTQLTTRTTQLTIGTTQLTT